MTLVSRTQPQFPVYIVSKGRWASRYTARYLSAMGTPYYVVIEAAEREQYAEVIDPARLLILDPAYQRDYVTCDDLGLTKSTGPGPARNFAWDHAVASGAAWHWVMDDNIRGFGRYVDNRKIRMRDGTGLRVIEDFMLRYTNAVMGGPQYYMFVPRKTLLPPFVLNTRIYSCNLIRNDLPFRWRGRYNEDTDLSLRILKAGLCTVQFNAILQWKMPTQHVPGGNTADFYSREGTLAKSQMQVRLHPDVSRLVWKFGRAHHHVDYGPFKGNRLIRRPGVIVPTEADEYGLRLIDVPDEVRVPQ